MLLHSVSLEPVYKRLVIHSGPEKYFQIGCQAEQIKGGISNANCHL